MLHAHQGNEIALAFGLGDALSFSGPVARGEVGQIWRLQTTSGAWAVKETFEAPDPGEVAESAAFQEAATLAGVATPRVVRTPAGEVQHEPGGVRVYEWVDLLAPDRLVDPAAVGRLLASIHGVEFAGTMPLHPWHTDPVGAARWRELAAAMIAAQGPHAYALEALCDELIALEGLLEPPRDLTTCHRDLWADNLLPTPSGGLCVVDWDGSGLADRSQELALVLCDFCGHDPRRAPALYRSYLDAGGPGRLSRPQDFSMAIAQIGHIGEMAIETWLDPATPAGERDRQVPRIEEFVLDAFTRAHYDGIVAALRGT